MEAQIFKHQDVAVRHAGNGIPRTLPENVRLDRNCAAEETRQASRDGLNRKFRHHLAFWPTKMGQDNDFGAFAPKSFEPRKNAPYTGVVGHLAIGQRHVEIKPDKATPPGGIDLVDEQKRRIHQKTLI